MWRFSVSQPRTAFEQQIWITSKEGRDSGERGNAEISCSVSSLPLSLNNDRVQMRMVDKSNAVSNIISWCREKSLPLPKILSLFFLFYPPSSLSLSLSLQIKMHACAHIFALHIYKYVKEKCHASSSYRIATLCQQQGPTRPTRTNLSTVSGLPLQRLATLSPCSFEFIGACSNIHKKETSLAKRSSTRFAPLVFLILQRRPPWTATLNYYTDF